MLRNIIPLTLFFAQTSLGLNFIQVPLDLAVKDLAVKIKKLLVAFPPTILGDSSNYATGTRINVKVKFAEVRIHLEDAKDTPPVIVISNIAFHVGFQETSGDPLRLSVGKCSILSVNLGKLTEKMKEATVGGAEDYYDRKLRRLVSQQFCDKLPTYLNKLMEETFPCNPETCVENQPKDRSSLIRYHYQKPIFETTVTLTLENPITVGKNRLVQLWTKVKNLFGKKRALAPLAEIVFSLRHFNVTLIRLWDVELRLQPVDDEGWAEVMITTGDVLLELMPHVAVKRSAVAFDTVQVTVPIPKFTFQFMVKLESGTSPIRFKTDRCRSDFTMPALKGLLDTAIMNSPMMSGVIIKFLHEALLEDKYKWDEKFHEMLMILPCRGVQWLLNQFGNLLS